MHFRPSDASPMALRPRPGLCRGTFIVSIQKNNMSRVWGRMPPGTARALLGSRLAANRPLSITSSACALNPSGILKPLYSALDCLPGYRRDYSHFSNRYSWFFCNRFQHQLIYTTFRNIQCVIQYVTQNVTLTYKVRMRIDRCHKICSFFIRLKQRFW